MKVAAPTYSVIVPVYRNEATLAELLSQLAAMARGLAAPLEVVFVLDGTPDNSYALLKDRLPQAPFPSQLICLSRNFGSFAAIRAGLEAARGSYIAFLAADLQQPIASVEEFFRALEQGADVAIGQRLGRSDPWLSRLASTLFWAAYRRFVQRDVPSGGVDAFGCTRRVRDVLVTLPEANSTLIGLLLWVGYRRSLVGYTRAPRPSGSSGWSLTRKLRYAFDSAFAFSDLPVTIMMALGIAGVASALIATIVAIALSLAGWAAVQGYTVVMLALLWSVSIIILALGVIGSYVWRVFENTKGRPAYLVQSSELIVPRDAAGMSR